MKRFITFLFIFLCSIAVVSAVPFCVNEITFECDFGIEEEFCTNEAGYFLNTPPNPALEAKCTDQGCCAPQNEIMNGMACGILNGIGFGEELPTGLFDAGQSCTGQQICLKGETNCFCLDQFITGNQVCCTTFIGDQTCGDPPDPGDPPNPELCGNNIWEGHEPCDPTVSGAFHADPDICPPPPPGVTQICTAACTCPYDPADYPDDVCSPINPCDPPGEEGCTDLIGVQAPIVHDPTILTSTQVSISWTIPPTCEDTLSHLTLQITPSGEIPNSFSLDKDTRDFAFTYEAGTFYDGLLTAHYDVGTIQTLTTFFSFFAPDEECAQGRDSWCVNSNTRGYCEDGMYRTETCNAGQCAATSPTTATCTEHIVSCDDCNLAYEGYAETQGATTEIFIEVEGQQQAVRCDQLDTVQVTTNEGGAFVAFCFLDSTLTALQEYRSCAEDIRNCVHYGSQQACQTDVCSPGGTCAWTDLTGTGTHGCTAQEEEYHDCDVQDQLLCEAQSSCFWAIDKCFALETGTCRNYPVREQCLGTPESSFAIPTDTKTHQPSSTSNDLHGYGKCKWNDAAQSCYKDANDDGFVDSSICEDDFTNPTMTLDPNLGSIYNDQTIEIAYAAQDDSTLASIYAELHTGPCQENEVNWPPPPVETTAVDTFQSKLFFPPQETGDYCVRYYAEDCAGNLGIVEQQTIAVLDNTLAFTTFETIAIPDFTIQATRIEFRFTTDRQASCTYYIQGIQTGFHLSSGDPQFGTSFILIHPAAANDQYELHASCETTQGATIERTEMLSVDIDVRISNPTPAGGAYKQQDVPQLSVQTSLGEDTTCQYGENDIWTTLTEKTHIEGDEWRHAGPNTQTESRYYQYDTRCLAEDGVTWLLGAPADRIFYAIDDLAPTTRLTYLDEQGQEQEITQAVVPIQEEQQRTQLTVTCTDQPITGNNDNHEAGCENIYYDAGLGLRTLATTEFGGQLTGTLSIDRAEQITIWSEDTLGNTEQAITIFGEELDISGPERPTYEVQP